MPTEVHFDDETHKYRLLTCVKSLFFGMCNVRAVVFKAEFAYQTVVGAFVRMIGVLLRLCNALMVFHGAKMTHFWTFFSDVWHSKPIMQNQDAAFCECLRHPKTAAFHE